MAHRVRGSFIRGVATASGQGQLEQGLVFTIIGLQVMPWVWPLKGSEESVGRVGVCCGGGWGE
jgi:hypothetical protein